MHNTRLDALTEYPFQRLATLIQGVTPKAAPADQIAMSIGEPQHRPPELIRELLVRDIDGWGKYPPTPGTPDFRRAVADWAARRYRLPAGMIDGDANILPVAGSREALFMAAQLCVPPDKRGKRPTVLMPNPFYQVYFGAAVMHGAEPVFVPATAATGFQPDYALAGGDNLARAAMAYLCTPANPQGKVATLKRLTDTIRLAREHDFVLISDECYSEIYDGAAPAGALEACAALGGDLGNVLVFNSLSKRSSVPGLRSGFVAGDAKLIARFNKLRAHGGAVQPVPVLETAAALWRDETHVEANRALYRLKFADAAATFGNSHGYYTPDGGFFLWLDVGDGERATRALWAEAGVKVLPGAYLARPDATGANPGARYIRVALVHDRDRTKSALLRMKRVIDDLT
ncbi:MAG: aminotransferase class I/II-fold pyridoxal phosphate-dependent enzyme [Alphaproteobacteria bacterium]|nr:aminotransferase class I/II-fold pyridoxal phosphate-dependent enzyme [Alphaproteobacteria bacterium]